MPVEYEPNLCNRNCVGAGNGPFQWFPKRSLQCALRVMINWPASVGIVRSVSQTEKATDTVLVMARTNASCGVTLDTRCANRA